MNTNIQLAGLIFLLLISCSSPNKNTSGNKSDEQNEKAAGSEYQNWQGYSNQEYDFSLQLPPEWNSREFSVGDEYPVINFFPSDKSQSVDLPITVHADARVSFIAVYPQGYGIELPMGKSRKLTDSPDFSKFSINQEESTVFMLENDEEWGYFFVPSSSPASWKEHGFIFAQITTDNFEAKCFDKESGEELEMSECDPMMGDVIKRTGSINKEAKEVVNNILKSFSLGNSPDNNQQNESGSEGIRVEQPTSGAEISSPVQMEGEARGNWYFEAEFTVVLNQNGKELAETIVKAQGEWMTNDFVPFSATMQLPDEAEEGEALLVFKNSNPSGKPELDKTYRVPVQVKKR